MSFAHETPFGSTRQETVIGIVLVIIVISTMIFFLVSNKRGATDSQTLSYFTTLKESYGISQGASITMKGLVIGEVTSIGFNDDANIAINFNLANEHRSFYTSGSYLQPDNSLGLDQVISGSGLVFISAGKGNSIIPPGTYIKAVELKSLNDSLAELDINKTIAAVQAILANLKDVTESVASNRDSIQEIMNNTAVLTENMIATNKKMNELVDNLGNVASKSNEIMDTTLTENLKTLNATMKEYQSLASDLRELSQSLKPTMEATPELVANIETLMYRSNIFMTKLSNHWLLNSGQSDKSKQAFRVNRSNKKPESESDGTP